MTHCSWVVISKSAFVFAIVGLLFSCGFGPLRACRTECKFPEKRDLFCGCYVPKPNDGPTIGPPAEIWSRPYLYRKSSSTPNCFANSEAFVFNQNNRDVRAQVSSRVRNSVDNAYKWISVGKNTVSIDKAPSLGMERLEPDCFDQFFFLTGRWEFTDTKVDGDLDNLAKTKGLSLESAKRHQEVQRVRSAIPLNCQQICNPSDLSAACLVLNPPQTALVDRARENVLSALNSGDIDWSIVLAPILGETGDCKRSQVLTSEGVITNQGEACAYPFKLNPSDSVPMAIIHIPSVLKFDTNAAKSDRKIKSTSIYESPYIGFRNKTFTEAYGGHIQEVTADDHSLYYKTDAPACIEISTR